MIKVLVVDDHDLVRIGIMSLLEDVKGLKVVGQACSGEEAINCTKELNPDVILMDIKMPGIGGLEATKKLNRLHPDIKVLAVTAMGADPFPHQFMSAGASGFLTKGADPEEMIKAIRVVHSGQQYINAEIAQQMALRPFKQQGNSSPFDQLSNREMQIFMMIVNCHKVQEISDKLCLSPKTVNSYRYRLFEKLNINSDVELTLLAVRHGMLDTDTSTSNF